MRIISLLENLKNVVKRNINLYINNYTLSSIYTVKVKFESTQKFIVDEINKEIEVSIQALPVRGQANKEIISKISTYFKVKKSDVQIIRGLNSKTKIVKIL